MINDKDQKTLINKPNQFFLECYGVGWRARIENAGQSIIDFYERNAGKINAEVVIVRTKDDEPNAALARNSGKNTLFVFAAEYWVTSYFSGTTELISFSKALVQRANKVS